MMFKTEEKRKLATKCSGFMQAGKEMIQVKTNIQSCQICQKSLLWFVKLRNYTDMKAAEEQKLRSRTKPPQVLGQNRSH